MPHSSSRRTAPAAASAWSDYGPDMIESQGDFNRPWLVGSFGTEILPAIPAIHERLVADPPARVADVAVRCRLVGHRHRPCLPERCGSTGSTSTDRRSSSRASTPRDAGVARSRHVLRSCDAASSAEARPPTTWR